MDLGLAGARALVTGDSRGIGLVVGRALAAEGARVALLGRDVDALAAAAMLTGPDTLTLMADTTDDAAVRAAVDAVASGLGGLDVVVNAAAPRAHYAFTLRRSSLADYAQSLLLLTRETIRCGHESGW